jgi:hypothetical protein
MLRITLIPAAFVLLAGCVVSPVSQLPSDQSLHTGRLSSFASSAHCPAYRKGSGILTDGDFHLAADPGASYLTFNQGQRLARSWKVTTLNINLAGSTFWEFDHLCSVDLDGQSAVGAIEHIKFPTKKGMRYTLSFLMSGNPDCPPTTKNMKVSVPGASTRYHWNTSNGHDVRHGVVALKRVKFTAVSSRSTVTFTSLDPTGSGCGPVIGAIGVKQI